jgi:hypothetical protein
LLAKPAGGWSKFHSETLRDCPLQLNLGFVSVSKNKNCSAMTENKKAPQNTDVERHVNESNLRSIRTTSVL